MNLTTAPIEAALNATAELAASAAIFTGFDYFVFVLLLTVSTGIGIYFGYFDGKEQTTEEYLLGGRRMKTIPIAISLVASQISAIALVSLPADAYIYGTSFLISITPLLFVFFFFMSKAILPIFYHNKIDNCLAYLEMRFDKRTRTMVTISFFMMVLFILPVGGFVPALAFSSVTGYNIHLVNAVVTAVCVAYTMMGGIKAVVWTDVLQAIVMIGSICTVFVAALSKVDGFSEVLRRAVEGQRLDTYNWSIDLKARITVWNTILSGLFIWISHMMFNQSCIQRLCSLPSIRDATRCLYIVAVGCALIFTGSGLLSLVMYTYYYNCDPLKTGTVEQTDKLVPQFVNDVVGWIPGMTGLFISSVFSASLSTTSAYLNTLGGICYTDYIRKIPGFVHTEQKAQLIMKSIVLLFGIYCVLSGFLVEQAGSLFQIFLTILNVTMGCISGVYTLGMFFPRSNHQGAFWGCLVAMLTVTIIVVGNSIAIARGEFKYDTLPTNVDGCSVAQNISMASFINHNTDASSAKIIVDDDSFSIFRISFMWFAFIGAVTVWLVGLPISCFFGPQNWRETLDPNLISPWTKFLLPNDMKHVAMIEMARKDCDVGVDDDVDVGNGNAIITYSKE